MKKIIIFSVLILSLFLGSCGKFLDVNDNPNDLTKVNLSVLMPAITVNIGSMGAGGLMTAPGIIMQQYSGNGPIAGRVVNKELEVYNFGGGNGPELGGTYSGVLADIAILIKQAETEGSPHYAGVGKILKAYIYHLLVDGWGSVPYFESTEFMDNPYPKYDKGDMIYTDLFRLIDEGITDINAVVSAQSPNSFETIYQSTSWEDAKVKWIRLANTLKLRLYLHYSKIDPSFTSSQISALINSGAEFMQSNDDNFIMPFLSESKRQNPLYFRELGQFKSQFYPNQTVVDMMNVKNDPRRAAYFVPFPYNSDPETYKGTTILNDVPSSGYSQLHSYFFGTPSAVNEDLIAPDGSLRIGAITYGGNSPARLLTFAEYNFIRAEAALLYGAPGDAQTFFTEGIRASCEDAGVKEDEINTYLSANGTLSGTSQQKEEQIINEKYIANMGVAMEPWTDYRRTGYPAITPIPGAYYNEIPRSFLYDQEEIDNNPNVTQKQSLLDRVFWDVQ